ncbi:uncharacterized protein SAPINGB_P001546 [Magnusiomyces paraingens]|uniref:Low temperature requirement protein A n=1 Tax=Magnusiomyces paraingens TaxID=2606893 RepID=A0A5E8B6I2_9ASCO|nr:uncharacterized protein SAPINGB_P001546 [Saprochaete ingens]VVT47107.1 unnamed protein product [Saprochaete ingens]
MPWLLKLLSPILGTPEKERQRALDRISRSTPVEEGGFKFYSLPNEEAEEHHLFQRPEALQFFYNGKLYKVTGERASGVFELFLDLLYVAMIALFSSDVAEHPDWPHLLKYLVIFFHSYQIWQDLRETFDNYYTDDILQRGIVLSVMIGMAIFANNAAYIGFGHKRSEVAYLSAVISFQVVHFILIANWFFYSLFIPEHLVRMRVMGCINIFTFLLRSLLLIPHTSWTFRIIIALLALAIERGFWVYIYSPWFQTKEYTEFSTAVNIEHESDRMTALYIIVLGEFLNSLISDASIILGLDIAAGRAVMVLIIAFSLNWLYVHNDGSVKNTHALRRSALTAIGWFIIHEPLCAALVLSGDIAAEFVKYDILENYNLEWFFCYGLAIGTFSLWIMAQCTLARDELVWPKQIRLLFRLIDVIIFALLPFAKLDTSNTLLVASVLMVITVVWENYGSLPKDHNIFTDLCYEPNQSSAPLLSSEPHDHSAVEQEVEALLHANETIDPGTAEQTANKYGSVGH